jgi:hypothetical protein
MVESRWSRRISPVLAALGAVVAVVATTAGATATWAPPPCAGPPSPGAGGIGAWYRLDPTIVDGVRTGQRLSLGRADALAPSVVDLDPESFASGPFGGTVLAGTDDGRSSRMSLIDLAAGCAWSVGTAGDVIRHATVTPDGSAIVEFRVDRRTRADLGVWSRPLDGREPRRILGPLEADSRFGPTWLTELGWSDDGGALVVQSCGEVACRFRLLDLRSGSTAMVADPSIGSLVGVADDHIVARGACRGLPCPLVALRRDGGPPVMLDEAAGQAVMIRDAVGRSEIVHEVGGDPTALRAVRPDGRDSRALSGPADGRRLVGPPGWSGGASEPADGGVAVGRDGRLELAGNRPAVFRLVTDGRTVPLPEVSR